MDIGADVGIRLELDVTAANGILDRQGISKVRHIDFNWLWLQAQNAKRIVPLNRIPGEVNTANLMTKHFAITMILRHMSKLNLVHVGGRSDAAAKLHSVEESLLPSRTSALLGRAGRARQVGADSGNAFSGCAACPSRLESSFPFLFPKLPAISLLVFDMADRSQVPVLLTSSRPDSNPS